MNTQEYRFIPCPECGDERGKTQTCQLCLQYNPHLRKSLEKAKKPQHGPGSDEWEQMKKKIASK